MATAARDSESRAIAKIRKKRGSVAIPAPRSKRPPPADAEFPAAML